jgi:hypothetical protein
VADQARQDRARAHVAAGQADAVEQERGLAARGADRRSDAIATIAPAPAQTPSIAATIGCGQARIVFTRSPVIRVNISSSGAFRRHQRADDLVHVAARAEVVASAVDHDGFHIVGVLQVGEQLAQLGIRVERQRVLALGPVQRHMADPILDLPGEVLRLIAGGGSGIAGGEAGVDAGGGGLIGHLQCLRVSTIRCALFSRCACQV